MGSTIRGGGVTGLPSGTQSSTEEEALMSNTWNYRKDAWSEGDDVVGYEVEATDGTIGKIDEATSETDRSYVVVDTGSWIFDKRRLIPAGLVSSVDHDAHTVTITLSKDQIKAAPDYDESAPNDDVRRSHEEHYGSYSS
jgi:hypothetical protein